MDLDKPLSPKTNKILSFVVPIVGCLVGAQLSVIEISWFNNHVIYYPCDNVFQWVSDHSFFKIEGCKK